jgi:hypothetical protein
LLPYLHVGCSQGADFQNVLQLQLGKFVQVCDVEATLWHNGQLTAGRGAVSRATVMEAVREQCPHLLREDRVQLARLDLREPANTETLRSMLAQCVEYALVRQSVKERAKSRSRSPGQAGRS